MNTLILLVAPVQDSTAIEHTISNEKFGMFLLVCFGIYLIGLFGSIILNRILKGTNNYCSETSYFFPLANIACFFCRIIQFFKASTYNGFKKMNKEKREKREAEKQNFIMQRIKERTKGLTDI